MRHEKTVKTQKYEIPEKILENMSDLRKMEKNCLHKQLLYYSIETLDVSILMMFDTRSISKCLTFQLQKVPPSIKLH